MMSERNTVQKTLVYDALCRLANHPTADAVYEEVKSSCPTISRATVYRILNKLAEKGVISKVNLNNGADIFDHNTFPHYHIRCIRCGKVRDVKLAAVHDLAGDVLDSSGYRITGYSIQFDGICPQCEEREAGGARRGKQEENDLD